MSGPSRLHSLSAALVRRRGWLLFVALATVAPAALALDGLQSDNSIYTFLAASDPELEFYRQTSDTFGGDSQLYVSVESRGGSIFNVHELGRVDHLSGALEAIDGVERVVSLSTTSTVRHTADGVDVGPLIQAVPRTRGSMDRLRSEVLSSPLLRDLVSVDGAATVLTVQLDRARVGEPSFQHQVVQQIRRCLDREGGPDQGLRIAGDAVVAEAIEQHSQREQRTFSMVLLLLVAGSCFVLFRRLRASLLPVLVIVVCVAWTMGLFILAGHRTNAVTSFIAPVLCLTGMSCAAHFLFRHQDLLAGGASPEVATRRTFRAVLAPCFFTALTTAVGFGSLGVSQVRPIQVFGLFAGLGVLLSLVAAICLVPSLLAAGGPAPGRSFPLLDRLLDRVERSGRGSVRAILLLSVALLVWGVAGISRIRLETDVLEYFRDDARVVQDALFIEEAYGGSSSLDVIIDTGRPGGALSPEVLEAVAALQDRYASVPNVVRGVSLADLVRQINQAVVGDPGGRRLPRTAAATRQLLLTLGTPETLEPMVDFQRRVLRLSTRFSGASLGVAPSRALLARLRLEHEGLFPPGVTVRFTGFPLLYIDMDRYLVRSQILSFALVLGVLLLLLAALYRSLTVGLLAMIPNVLPIAVVLGLMGWLGIPLEGSTIMIASIAIGIGVDDTIHFLHRFRAEVASGADLSAATRATLRGVGRPVLFTSTVLTLGFWVFCFSDFIGMRNFGGLTGVAIVAALLADLLVLPAILRATGAWRRWCPDNGGLTTGARSDN